MQPENAVERHPSVAGTAERRTLPGAVDKDLATMSHDFDAMDSVVSTR